MQAKRKLATQKQMAAQLRRAEMSRKDRALNRIKLRQSTGVLSRAIKGWNDTVKIFQQ